MFRRLAPLVLFIVLSACQTGTTGPEVRRAEPAVASRLDTIPSDACWATDRVPAVTETVYDVTDASGTRTPRAVVLRPAEERLFAVPCPEQMRDGFVASLQRALTARGLYAGSVSGVFDSETAAAVRLFQAPQGLDSAVLTLQAAQQLGLVPVARDLH